MSAVLLIAAAVLNPAAAASTPPRVLIVHQGLVERYCAASSGHEPAEGLAEQVSSRIAEFRDAWAALGPELMQATVAVTGAAYGFAETVATLHACPDMGSMSAPLLIDAGRYLEAHDGEEAGQFTERERRHFAYTLWHEIEHRHIGEMLRARGGSTPLLRAHAGESQVTLVHLHLLAIEQLVYRRLGREEEFHLRGRNYARQGNSAYARAYEIVLAEGAEALVAELRPGA